MKYLKNFGPWFVLLIILNSCVTYSTYSTAYDVQEQFYDSLENPFTTYTQTIYHDRSVTVWFTISVEKTDSTKTDDYFQILVEYMGNDWLFMPGEVLIQADSLPLIRIEDNDPHRITGPGGVKETIRATIDKEQLIAISEANTVRMQFYAEPLTIDSTGMESLRRFVDEYVR